MTYTNHITTLPCRNTFGHREKTVISKKNILPIKDEILHRMILQQVVKRIKKKYTPNNQAQKSDMSGLKLFSSQFSVSLFKAVLKCV